MFIEFTQYLTKHSCKRCYITQDPITIPEFIDKKHELAGIVSEFVARLQQIQQHSSAELQSLSDKVYALSTNAFRLEKTTGVQRVRIIGVLFNARIKLCAHSLLLNSNEYFVIDTASLQLEFQQILNLLADVDEELDNIEIPNTAT